MIHQLDTPEAVQKAMLAGLIAPISMAQCAYVHGDKMVEAFLRWDELRADLKSASDVLVEFAGKHVWEQAQSAVEHIAYLRRAANIAAYHERAAYAVSQQDRRELERARRLLANCAIVMRANDPGNARVFFGPDITNPTIEEQGHEQVARQTGGPAGTQQERSEGQEGVL